MVEIRFILQVIMIALIVLTFIFYSCKPVVAKICAVLLFITLGLGIGISIAETIGVVI